MNKVLTDTSYLIADISCGNDVVKLADEIINNGINSNRQEARYDRRILLMTSLLYLRFICNEPDWNFTNICKLLNLCDIDEDLEKVKEAIDDYDDNLWDEEIQDFETPLDILIDDFEKNGFTPDDTMSKKIIRNYNTFIRNRYGDSKLCTASKYNIADVLYFMTQKSTANK